MRALLITAAIMLGGGLVAGGVVWLVFLWFSQLH
jgi:hypothetical protein